MPRVRHAPLLCLGVLLALGACGEESADGPVSAVDPDAPSATAPFSGDLSGPRGAERALECDGPIWRHGRGDLTNGLEEVGDSAADGWSRWLEAEGWDQYPTRGYVVEREDGDRTLISFDSDGRTKLAAVLQGDLTDYRDEVGWGVESYAFCDPAEWPAETTEELGLGIWTTRDGDRVPYETIRSFAGPEHCSWQDSTWLWLGPEGREGEFLREPRRELQRYLRTTYAADVDVPPDAVDTGWSRDGRGLWLAADRSAAYLLGDDGRAERWPATRTPVRCA